MNKEETIKLAREAGFDINCFGAEKDRLASIFERFAALVIEAEKKRIPHWIQGLFIFCSITGAVFWLAVIGKELTL